MKGPQHLSHCQRQRALRKLSKDDDRLQWFRDAGSPWKKPTAEGFAVCEAYRAVEPATVGGVRFLEKLILRDSSYPELDHFFWLAAVLPGESGYGAVTINGKTPDELLQQQ